MSLRFKLTVSFLLISLVTAAAIGAVAYSLLMWNFRQSVRNRAFLHFRQDVAAYIGTYGSWREGMRTDPFPGFVIRRHRYLPPPRPSSGRPPRGHPLPPFRFLLLDDRGRVLLPVEGYQRGQQVSKTVLKTARPVRADGKVAALAAPIGDANLSPDDRAYLVLTQRALAAGVLVAGVLALLTGLLLSRRMSASLTEVTEAIKGMRPDGELPRQVPVRSRDEIGMLAEALNRMSSELAQAHRTVQAQTKELRELSVRDPLTGLYNRRHFDEQAAMLFKQAVRHKRPLTVAVCDLDHFKLINDRFSHGVGDEVLRRIGRLLSENMRASDVIARYGGEEFVLICVDSTLTQTAQRCEELRRRIEAHPWCDLQPDLKVTASMGLCESLSTGGVEGMLAEADARLYEAKHAGRNRVMPAQAGQRSGIPSTEVT